MYVYIKYIKYSVIYICIFVHTPLCRLKMSTYNCRYISRLQRIKDFNKNKKKVNMNIPSGNPT